MAATATDGLQWNWPTSSWAWDPSQGPWRAEYGAPLELTRIDISTAEIAPRESYDFWRSIVFYNFSAHRPDDDQRRSFRAAGTGFFVPNASIGFSSTDPLRGSRHMAQHRADGLDDITIGYVTEGARWQVDESGEHRARPGDFYVYDAAHAAEVGWLGGGGVYLALSRELVHRSGCSPDIAPNLLARQIAASPLAPFLAAQFALLWQRGRSIADADMGRLFPALTAMAQAAMASPDAPDVAATEPGRFAAASRFIRGHLGEEDLSPGRIAAAVGCSRATLYRLFAERDLPIASYVRELRLQGAMAALSSNPGSSVSAVAARFGFSDLSTFSQSFRRRFGISPRDVGR